MQIRIIAKENEHREPIDVAKAIIDGIRDADISLSSWKYKMAFIDEVADHIKAYTEHSKDRWESKK